MKQRIFIINNLITSILISFALLSISRVIFFIFNLESFSHFHFSELLQSFSFGIFFDSVYIFYALSPFIIFLLLPFHFKTKKLAYLSAKFYFSFVVGLGFLLNLIDSIYFHYSHKRTGKELFYMIADSANPIGSYFLNYWYLLIILSILVYITFKIYPKYKAVSLAKYTLADLPVTLAIIAISVLGMRGSIGLKPLRSVDASRYALPELEALTLNTPFQIISSLESKKPSNPFAPVQFTQKFDSTQTKFYGNSPIVKGKKNIVLIILESFGRNRIGFLTTDEKKMVSATPFIDSFSKFCLVFPNCYANGSKSIDAVPALFASLPSLLEQPFIYSWYQANTIRGIHFYLDQIGYNSSFYHGAANGTMGFESFLKKAGPIEYFGLDQYNGNRNTDYDGNWGIYDHIYLHYYNKELEKKTQPYFSSIFTLSSHPPYKIPNNISPLLPNLPNEMLKSIAYTDYSLKLFFEERAKSSDNQNTIYILIGDHTANSDNDYFYSAKGQMELFCMIYDPTGEIKPGVNNRIVQQLDMMPTILNLCNYPNSFFSLGNSFFDIKSTGRAFFEMYGSLHIVEDEHIYSETTTREQKFRYFPKQYYKLPIPFFENQRLEENMKSTLYQLIGVFYDKMEKNHFY
ncbi:MAG: sulfatase-like hydrolase/transferase [Bacteroidetes bacterium]|nr:sulfatase-like hydrolase/transferase [Bacteroidota bacterium]